MSGRAEVPDDVTVPADLAAMTEGEVAAWRAGFVAGFVALNECDCAIDSGGCPTCIAYGEAVARARTTPDDDASEVPPCTR